LKLQIPKEVKGRLLQAARLAGIAFAEELSRALYAGRLILEIEDTERGNAFLSERGRFMEEMIPALEAEIRWLAAAIDQAKKDRQLMENIVANRENL